MFACLKCDKTFATQRGLNAHQVAHSNKIERYSPSRKKIRVLDCSCEFCNKAFAKTNSTMNKFCSNECFAKYQWERVSVPKILQGLGGNLKRYLRETRGECCEKCNQGSIWNNSKLTLQLDHIDGNSDNNSVSNIRLLCPNCHSQTDTFGSKGAGNRYKKHTKRNKYLREYKA